jgi:hypothetical protein
MSRKDTFHDIVRRALEKDGWIITHDPLLLRYELGNLYTHILHHSTSVNSHDSISIIF